MAWTSPSGSVASSMAGDRIPLPHDYCIPWGLERSETGEAFRRRYACRPHAGAELLKSVTQVWTVPRTLPHLL